MKPTISFSLLLLQVFSELKHFPSLTLPPSFLPLAHPFPSFLPPYFPSLLPLFVPSSSLPSSLLPFFLRSPLPFFLPSLLPSFPSVCFLPFSFLFLTSSSFLSSVLLFPCPYSFPSFSFLPPFLPSFPFPFSFLAFSLYVIKRSSLDVLDIDIFLAVAKINPVYFRSLN